MADNKISTLRKLINSADAIVVGGASGLSAASGFRFYYEDDDVFKKLAGKLGEKYDAKGGFPLMYTRGIEKEELWAYYIREFKYLYECETGQTYYDLAKLLKGKNYYIVTTNQDAQFYRTFPANKITRLQGDFRYWQCKDACTDELYNNRDKVKLLARKVKDDRLPKDAIPRCPHCGAELIPWWRGYEFMEGSLYQREEKRYLDFIRRNQRGRILFLELGVGNMTPMFIHDPFVEMTAQIPGASLAIINTESTTVPRGITRKTISIKGDIAKVFRQLLDLPTGRNTPNGHAATGKHRSNKAHPHHSGRGAKNHAAQGTRRRTRTR